MHLSGSLLSLLVALSPLAAFAAADSATPTATGSGSSTTGVTSLVAELPKCAYSCFVSSTKAIGCASTDFGCLCSNDKITQLVSTMGPCITSSSGCTGQEVTETTQVAAQICADINNGANSADLASASSYVSSALATVSGATLSGTSSTGAGTTATTSGASSTAGNSVSSTTSHAAGARRTDMAVGVIGAAALLMGAAAF